METTTSTESPLLDKIPAEIRLLVYEEVLRFERPLVKVKPSTRPIRANTNLLLVNKQITQEALPALYKSNTIALRHGTLCDLGKSKARIQYGLVKHLRIRLDAESCDRWMSCVRCLLLDGLINLLVNGRFPNLQMAVIDFNENCAWITQSRENLQEKGMDIEFTGVGEFRVVNVREGVAVCFEHRALRTTWHLVAGLRLHELNGTWTEIRDATSSELAIPARLVIEICCIFRSFRFIYGREHTAEPRNICSGVQPHWLRAEYQNAVTFELITSCLERFARGGK